MSVNEQLKAAHYQRITTCYSQSVVWPSMVCLHLVKTGRTEATMTEQQIDTVKKSWRLLRGIDPVLLGDVFYSRLFVSHPELRVLFKGSMETQSKKLIDMLSYLVGQLHRFDELSDEVASLGQRHVQYGVKPPHYESVGQALLWTLEKGLGRDWNDNVAQAWAAMYGLITQKMMASANQHQSA
ncbi:hypothetical protein GCM10028807_51570 [Spirosoma daeguense]